MYIPKHYLVKGTKEPIAFMKRFNFGTIITSIDNSPIATHLPFVITEKERKTIIDSLSKSNDTNEKSITEFMEENEIAKAKSKEA